MGFTLRSFPFPEGIRNVSARKDPHAVPPVGAPAAEAVGRPNRPRLLGFCPSRSAWRPAARLTRRPLAAPLGFAPSRVSRQRPCPGSNPGSSHALPRGRSGPASPAPRSLNRPLLGPVHAERQADQHGPDNPSRVPAPGRSRTFEQAPTRAMNSPLAVPYIAADKPAIFG